MLLATARRLRSAAPATRINLALALLLGSYTLVRAARLSFTHDESVTFLGSVRESYAAILRSNVEIPSNNHLLNSLLAKACTVLGVGPFVLRLPNLLAHAGYLTAALFLARRVVPGCARVAAFLVLTLHPFLLDFFSLCRGYGLACGFELLALWLLVHIAEAPGLRPRRALAAMLLAALSPLANLSFLVFFLAFTGVLALIELSKWLRARGNAEERAAVSGAALLGSLGACGAVALALCAWVVPIGLKLRALGELYYGGERGFLVDTVGSLFEASRYYQPTPAWLTWALVGLGALLVVATIALALRLAARGRPTAFWLAALPLLTALICVVQHHAMGTKFPVDRTALFFVPMLALALVGASPGWSARGAERAWLAGVAALLLANAAQGLNLRYFAQWQFDASTGDMLERLAEARGEQRTVRIGANWLFEPSINYYRVYRGLSWLAPVPRGNIRDDLDYYYYLPGDEGPLGERRLERIQRFEVSNATLARRVR